jgi:hypothetical protein
VNQSCMDHHIFVSFLLYRLKVAPEEMNRCSSSEDIHRAFSMNLVTLQPRWRCRSKPRVCPLDEIHHE